MLCQIIADRFVIPSGSRFALFRSEHVVRIRSKDVCGFYRAHQACVKTDEFELVCQFSAVCKAEKCCIDLAKTERVIVFELIEADSGQAAAAVIPEYYSHFLCRIFFDTPLQEAGQGRGLSHRCLSDLTGFFQLPVLDDISAEKVAVYIVVMPV